VLSSIPRQSPPRSTSTAATLIRTMRDAIEQRVVGRETELDLILAALGAGRDLVLEGPPGTSKTTILAAIAEEWDVPVVFVEGNADLSPARLIGHHSPSQVLRSDFSAETFVAGPLVDAMTRGGFLYVDEFNRVPEETLNSLLTAVAERRIDVPRAGSFVARPTFRVIASMNPYDRIGTTRLSTSILDRFCRMAIGYQGEAEERAIVERRTGYAGTVVRDCVALTRATRDHPDVLQGSSVRGAIDFALVAEQLRAMRPEVAVPDEDEPPGTDYVGHMLAPMLLALSGRIVVDETAGVNAEQVLRDLWSAHFGLNAAGSEFG